MVLEQIFQGMNYVIFQIVALLDNQMPYQAGLVVHQIPYHTGSKPGVCPGGRGMGALGFDRDIKANGRRFCFCLPIRPSIIEKIYLDRNGRRKGRAH